MIPQEIVLQYDDHERDRLLFPSFVPWSTGPREPLHSIPLRLVRRRLEWADYSLEGFEDVVAIEKKKGLEELCTNLATLDAPRASRAFLRFATRCKYPYLLLCTTWQGLFGQRAQKHCRASPDRILDLLAHLIVGHGLRLIGPLSIDSKLGRLYAGRLVLSVLLAHAYPSPAYDLSYLQADPVAPILRLPKPGRKKVLRSDLTTPKTVVR